MIGKMEVETWLKIRNSMYRDAEVLKTVAGDGVRENRINEHFHVNLLWNLII